MKLHPLLFLLFMLPLASAYGLYGWLYQASAPNNAGLADYPASFIIDTQTPISLALMNANCSDLRAFSGAETAEYDYYLVPGTCNTNHTQVWVKIPAFTTGNNTVALKYGNATQADESNATNVFSNNYSAVWLNGEGIDALGLKTFTNRYGIQPGPGRYNPDALNATKTNVLIESAYSFQPGMQILRDPYNYGATYSGFAKINSYAPTQGCGVLVGSRSTGSALPIYSLLTCSNSGNLDLYFLIRGTGLEAIQTTLHTPASTWAYFAASMQDNYSMELSNGTNYALHDFAKATIGDFSHALDTYSLFKEYDGSSSYNYGYLGSLEAVFLATVPRSHDWLAAEANTQTVFISNLGPTINYDLAGFINYPNGTIAQNAYWVVINAATGSLYSAGQSGNYSASIANGIAINITADVMEGGYPDYVTTVTTTITTNTQLNVTLHRTSIYTGIVTYPNATRANDAVVASLNTTGSINAVNTTNANGEYVLVADESTAYVLASLGPSLYWEQATNGSQPLNLSLHYPRNVSGRVYYPNGSVSQAAVVAMHYTPSNYLINLTTVDPAGFYSLVTPYRYVTLLASESSEYAQEVAIDLGTNTTLNFNYPSFSLNGTVYWLDGTPATGLAVYLYNTGRTFAFDSNVTGNAGEFGLHVWNASAWSILVMARGNAYWFDRSYGQSPVNLTLSALAPATNNLQGHLYYGNGTPASTWYLHATNNYNGALPYPESADAQVLTASDGSFTATLTNSSGIPYQGWVWFLASNPNDGSHGAIEYMLDYRAWAGEAADFYLNSTTKAYFQLLAANYGDSSTRPLSGCRMSINQYWGPGNNSNYLGVTGYTDAEGKAYASNIPDFANLSVRLFECPGYEDSLWQPIPNNGALHVLVAYPDNVTAPWRYGINITFLPNTTPVNGGSVSFGVIASFVTIGVNKVDYWGYTLWNDSAMIYNLTRGAPTPTQLGALSQYMHDQCYLLIYPELRESCLLSYETDPGYLLATMNNSAIQAITVPVDVSGYSGNLVGRVFFHRNDTGQFVTSYMVYNVNPVGTTTPTPAYGGLAGQIPTNIGFFIAIVLSAIAAGVVGQDTLLSGVVFDLGLWLFVGAGFVPWQLALGVAVLMLIAFGVVSRQ